ncbi:MAG: hypothetical protein FWF29_12370 [Treponema sp.]|nr:hypothetical protein [Treponema sp.]
MTKRFILPVIFILVQTALSAQGFIFYGDVNSGLWAHFNNKVDGDPFLQVAGSDGVPVRINFHGAYDNADQTMGFNFNLRGQARNTLSGDDKPRIDPNQNKNLTDILYFERATAYLRLLHGVVTFTGGYWDPEDWETPGGLSTDLTMEGAGLIMDVAPLKGLDIMLSGWAKEGDTTLLGEAKYIITGIYQIPDVVRLVAHFSSRPYGPLGFSRSDDRNNYGGGTNQYPITTYDELRARDQRLAFGVGYLGLQSAGFRRLGVDTRVYNLGRGMTPGWTGEKMITITPFFTGQRITWDWNGLELDGRFYQRFNLGDDRWNYGPSLRFRVTARYDFYNTPLGCDVSPKIGFDLFTNSNPWGDNPVDMRFDEGVANWEDCDRQNGGWGLRPAIEFHFGSLSNALLELGYSLKVNTSKPDDTILITEKSTINHAFYIFVKVGVGKVVDSEDTDSSSD